MLLLAASSANQHHPRIWLRVLRAPASPQRSATQPVYATDFFSVAATLYEADASFDERAQGYGLTMQQGANALRDLGLPNEGVFSVAHASFLADGTLLRPDRPLSRADASFSLASDPPRRGTAAFHSERAVEELARFSVVAYDDAVCAVLHEALLGGTSASESSGQAEDHLRDHAGIG